MEGKAFSIIQDAWQHQLPLQWLARVHVCWLHKQTMMAVQMGYSLGLMGVWVSEEGVEEGPKREEGGHHHSPCAHHCFAQGTPLT